MLFFVLLLRSSTWLRLLKLALCNALQGNSIPSANTGPREYFSLANDDTFKRMTPATFEKNYTALRAVILVLSEFRLGAFGGPFVPGVKVFSDALQLAGIEVQ